MHLVKQPLLLLLKFGQYWCWLSLRGILHVQSISIPYWYPSGGNRLQSLIQYHDFNYIFTILFWREIFFFFFFVGFDDMIYLNWIRLLYILVEERIFPVVGFYLWHLVESCFVAISILSIVLMLVEFIYIVMRACSRINVQEMSMLLPVKSYLFHVIWLYYIQ